MRWSTTLLLHFVFEVLCVPFFFSTTVDGAASFYIMNTTSISNQVFGPNATVNLYLCRFGNTSGGICGDSGKTLGLYMQNVSFLDGTHVTIQAPSTGGACTVAPSLNIVAMQLSFGKECTLLVSGTYCNSSSVAFSSVTGGPVDVVVSDFALVGSSFFLKDISIGGFAMLGDALMVVQSSVFTVQAVAMHSPVNTAYMAQLFAQAQVSMAPAYALASSDAASWSLLSVVRLLLVDASSIMISASSTALPMVWCFACHAAVNGSGSSGSSASSSAAGLSLSNSGWLWISGCVIGSSSSTTALRLPSVLFDFTGTTGSSITISGYSRLQVYNSTIASGAFGGVVVNMTDCNASTVNVSDYSQLSVDSSSVFVGAGGALALLLDRSSNSSVAVTGGSRVGVGGHSQLSCGAACVLVSFASAANGQLLLADKSALSVQGGAEIVSCDVAVRVNLDESEDCSVVVGRGSRLAISDSGTVVKNVAVAGVLMSFTMSRRCALTVSSYSFVGIVNAASVLLSAPSADGVALVSRNASGCVVSVIDASSLGILYGVRIVVRNSALRLDFSYSQSCTLQLINGGVVGITDYTVVTYMTPLLPLLNISLSYAVGATVVVADCSSVVALARNCTAVNETAAAGTLTPLVLFVAAMYSKDSQLSVSNGSMVGLDQCFDCFPRMTWVASLGAGIVTVNGSLSINLTITVTHDASVIGIRNSSIINASSVALEIVFHKISLSGVYVSGGGTLGVTGGSLLTILWWYVIAIDLRDSGNVSLAAAGAGSVVGVRGMSTAFSSASCVTYVLFSQAVFSNISLSHGAVLGIAENSSAVGSGTSGYGVSLSGVGSRDAVVAVDDPKSVIGAANAGRVTGVSMDVSQSQRFACSVRRGGGFGFVSSRSAASADVNNAAVFFASFVSSTSTSVIVDGTGSFFGVHSTTCEPTNAYPALATFWNYVYAARIEVTNGGALGVVNSTMTTKLFAAFYMNFYNATLTMVLVSGPQSLLGASQVTLPLTAIVGGLFTLYLDMSRMTDVSVNLQAGGTLGLVDCSVPGRGLLQVALYTSVRVTLSVGGALTVLGLCRSTGAVTLSYQAMVLHWNASIDCSLLVSDGATVGVVHGSQVTSSIAEVISFLFLYCRRMRFIVDNGSYVGVHVNSRAVTRGSQAAMRIYFDQSDSCAFIMNRSSVVGASHNSTMIGSTGLLASAGAANQFTIVIEDKSVFGATYSSSVIGNVEGGSLQSVAVMVWATNSTFVALRVRRGGLIGAERNSTISSQWYGLSLYYTQCYNVSVIVDSESQVGARGGDAGNANSTTATFIIAQGNAVPAAIYVLISQSNNSQLHVLDGSVIGVRSNSDNNNNTDSSSSIVVCSDQYAMIVSCGSSNNSELVLRNGSSVELSGDQTTVTTSYAVSLRATSSVQFQLNITDESFVGCRDGASVTADGVVQIWLTSSQNASLVVLNHSAVGYIGGGSGGGGGVLNVTRFDCVAISALSCISSSVLISHGSDVGVFVDTYRISRNSTTPTPPLLVWRNALRTIAVITLSKTSNMRFAITDHSRVGCSGLFGGRIQVNISMIQVDISDAVNVQVVVANTSVMGIDARYPLLPAPPTATPATIFALCVVMVNSTRGVNVTVSIHNNSFVGIHGDSWIIYHLPASSSSSPSTDPFLYYSAIHLYGFNSTALSVEVSGQGSFFGVSGSGSLYVDQAVCVNMSQSTVPSVSLSSGAFIGVTNGSWISCTVAVVVDVSGTVNASLQLTGGAAMGLRNGVTFLLAATAAASTRKVGLAVDAGFATGLSVTVANESAGLCVQNTPSFYGSQGATVVQWCLSNSSYGIVSVRGNSTLIDVSAGSGILLGGDVTVATTTSTTTTSGTNSTTTTFFCSEGSSLIRVLSSQVSGRIVLNASSASSSGRGSTPMLFVTADTTAVVLLRDSSIGGPSTAQSPSSSSAVAFLGRWSIAPAASQPASVSPPVGLATIQRCVFDSSTWASLLTFGDAADSASRNATSPLLVGIHCSYWGFSLVDPALLRSLALVVDTTAADNKSVLDVYAGGCTTTQSGSSSLSVSRTASASFAPSISQLSFSRSESSSRGQVSVSASSSETGGGPSTSLTESATDSRSYGTTILSKSLYMLSATIGRPSGSLGVTWSRSARISATRCSHSLSQSVIANGTASVALTTSDSGAMVSRSMSCDFTQSISGTPTSSAAVAPMHSINPTLTAMQGTVSANSVVSALVLPTAALAAQRLTLLANLGACNDLPDVGEVLSAPVDFMNAPLQLRVGVEYGAWHRGAVIGDAAVWVGCVVVGFVLTLVARRAGLGGAAAANESIVASAARLRLPGLYFIIVALLLQQVVVSSVLLLGYGGGSSSDGGSASSSAADRVIGACGLLLSCVIAGSMARVLDPRRRCFRAVAEPAERATQRRRWPNAVMRWLKAESVEWRPRDEAGDALFVERYGFLFESCSDGRHWWLLVDVLSTLVLGVVSGVVPATVTSCLAEVWFAVSLCAVQLVAVMALRPLNNRLEFGIVVLLYALQLVIALCSALNAAPDVVYVLGIVFSAIAALLAVIDLGDVFWRRLHWSMSNGNEKHTERVHRWSVNDVDDVEFWTATEVWAHPALLKLMLLVCLSRLIGLRDGSSTPRLSREESVKPALASGHSPHLVRKSVLFPITVRH